MLSEAEIIKMALSNQYFQETKGEIMDREKMDDPTQRLSKEEWKERFALFEQIRNGITPEDEDNLDEAIDRAVREVRAEKKNV